MTYDYDRERTLVAWLRAVPEDVLHKSIRRAAAGASPVRALNVAFELRKRSSGDDLPSVRWIGGCGHATARLLHLARSLSVTGDDALSWNWCPHCEQLVDADDVHDGSEVRCLGCGRVYVVEVFCRLVERAS